MEGLVLFPSPFRLGARQWPVFRGDRVQRSPRSPIRCSQLPSPENDAPKSNFKPGLFDDLLLSFFRKQMVEEVGWDSENPGYLGLIDVANRLLMKGKNNMETQESAVRVLVSLFPPFLLDLFKMLIAPIGGGKVASMMVEQLQYLVNG